MFTRGVTCITLLFAGLAIPATGQAVSDVALLPIEQCKPVVQAKDPFGWEYGVQINFRPREHRLSSTGTIRVTTLMVDFPDAPASLSPSAYFGSFVPQGLGFLESFSQGRLRIEAERPSSWIRMPKPSTAYGYSRGMSGEVHRSFIQDAVNAADSKVDFSDTDAVVVVMPPSLATVGYDVSPAYLGVPGFGLSADGHDVFNATTIGTDWSLKRPYVLAHELLHTMGLVDLYDFEGTWEGIPYVQRFVGPFSLMGEYSTNAEIFGWERWVLGWLSDEEAVCLGPGTHDVALNSVAIPQGDTRLAAVPLGGSRFLVLEARTKTGLDNAGKEGVVPYLVDPSIPTGSGPIRIPSTGPRSVMSPLVPGQTFIAEGIGVEVLSRTHDSFNVRVYTTLPTATLPDQVHSVTTSRQLRTVTVFWQEPLRKGWVPTTTYEYRVGSGSWKPTTDTKAVIRGVKRGQVLSIEIRAVNAVGAGPTTQVTIRIR